MRKTSVVALLASFAIGTNVADKKEGATSNRPVFTVVKQIPTASIKDQNRSDTRWDYLTFSYFEAEIPKKTGKTYDLRESLVANKTHMKRAIQVVCFHGDCQPAQGGSVYDVLYTLETYDICPESVMPLPGSLYGDSLNNFNEFFSLLKSYVNGIAHNKANKISGQWKQDLQGIPDAYLGKCPETLIYEGKQYTSKSFAASLGLNWSDYVTIISYIHHPFYSQFAVGVQDNWCFPSSYNLPMDEMARIIDNAVMNGYIVAWGDGISEPGSTCKGLAYVVDGKKVESMKGNDMAHWFGFPTAKKKDIIDSLDVNIPEVVPTQQQRQERFDNRELTDDHGMLIFGVTKDQNGKEYYMVKNSWGKTGDYKGIWYMTKSFIAADTMDYMVNKNATPKDIRKKVGL